MCTCTTQIHTFILPNYNKCDIYSWSLGIYFRKQERKKETKRETEKRDRQRDSEREI